MEVHWQTRDWTRALKLPAVTGILWEEREWTQVNGKTLFISRNTLMSIELYIIQIVSKRLQSKKQESIDQ